MADPDFCLPLHLLGDWEVLQGTAVELLAVAHTLLPASPLHHLSMYEALPASNLGALLVGS